MTTEAKPNHPQVGDPVTVTSTISGRGNFDRMTGPALESEQGCAAVLHLIVAARGAINGLMAEVIEDHIRLHVVDPAKGAERVRGAEELIAAVQSYLK